MNPERQDPNIRQPEQEAPVETTRPDSGARPYNAAAARNGRYSRDIQRYGQDLRDSGFYSDADTTAYAEEMKAELQRLVVPKNPHNLQPVDYALSLGKLAEAVADRNPVEDPAPETQKMLDDKQAHAQEVFMEASARIYPDTDVDVQRDLYNDMGKLFRVYHERESVTARMRRLGLSLEETQDLRKNNPTELLKRLDGMLREASSLLGDDSWQAFNAENDIEAKQMKVRIVTASQLMYRLQLMREQLQEEAYGRKDVTAAEAREIDAIRVALKGPEGETKTKEEEPLSPSEQWVSSKIHALVDAEDKHVIETEQNPTSTVARNYRPAMEAFKLIWKTDDAVAKRLIEIDEGLSATEERLGLTMDKTWARSRGVEETYQSLRAEERKALEDASEQDNKRQREKPNRLYKDTDGANMKIPPERLFHLLMEVLQNRPK